MHQSIRIILLLVLDFMLLACEPASNDSIKVIQVVDDTGEIVSLEKPAISR